MIPVKFGIQDKDHEGRDFPDAIKERLSPETQERIAKGSYKDHKSIVDQDIVTLTT
ncbi:MAG: hypothetical protein ACI8V2_002113 [Candidatus Latescibacterota bacterium]|jgi:hypothetical protein